MSAPKVEQGLWNPESVVPSPVLIGCRAKRVGTDVVTWLQQFGGFTLDVVEICSLGDCIAEPPDGWEERWDFNQACCYNSEREALSTLRPDDDPTLYDLFAYWQFPLEFLRDDKVRQIDLLAELDAGVHPIAPDLDLNLYESIGYDVAGGYRMYIDQTLTRMLGFSCSPLSCNGLAAEFRVNRLCLLPDLHEAVEFARHCARTEPEPGPFYLYEVLRKRSSRWSHDS